MSRLRYPNLPDGPLNNLYDALSELHALAGWPSTRTLAKGTAISHTTVYNILTCATFLVPNHLLTLVLVEKMAKLAGLNPQSETTRIEALWTGAWRHEKEQRRKSEDVPPRRRRSLTAVRGSSWCWSSPRRPRTPLRVFTSFGHGRTADLSRVEVPGDFELPGDLRDPTFRFVDACHGSSAAA